MNRIYRLVWSDRQGAFVPAAETARRRGKRSGGGAAIVGALVAGALSATALGAGSAGNALNTGRPTAGSAVTGGSTLSGGGTLPATGKLSAGSTLTAVAPTTLPTAPQVTLGQATITANGTQMLVTESTSSAAINWSTFNIGASAAVTFVQPTSTSVVLNRVLSADPSQIYGHLTANGIVFLINPQGVIVGQGAEVNVGGLVASSLNISNQDLLAGNWSFSGSSGSGEVSNAGSIRVAPGGFAALIGSKVENTGSISAKLGSVALASGNQVTLDFDESGLLKVGVEQATLNALVQNSGAIVADGGRIILTAKSAGDVLGTVVNNSGLLQSQSIGMRDGQVWLLAADPLANTGANGATANAGAVHDAAGGVVSSGSIDVSGKAGAAGEATLAGTTVTLDGSVDAGNANGSAGRVLINSTQATTLAASSSIDVSSAGAAGKLVAWSDGDTSAQGAVDGRGVGPSGTGATVEMSSAHGLGFDANVKLSAASLAAAGTLILDPATLEIAPGSGSAADTVYQSALQTQTGNIVLSATGQITVDALTNNVLNLANASSLTIASQNTGGIAFLNNGAGAPSGITTHDAPITLTASGSGALDNVGTLKSNGGDINLSGVFVHLGGGLDATNGSGAAGNVDVSVFGGAILSSSSTPIAGGQVTLDATYGYVGTAGTPVPTATGDLIVKTGGNAYVANTGSLATLNLISNHLEGAPVGMDITAANLQLSAADAVGDNTTYSNAVRWTSYTASNPSGLAGPSALTITEDNNLLPNNINLPQTALTLTSNQGYILGGNAQPVIASTLTLASPLGIGGADFYGVDGETDYGNPSGTGGGNTLLTQAGTITANVLNPAGTITGIVNLTAQGNLLGSVQASQVLLQATGNIGSTVQPFALNTGYNGEVWNLGAGGDITLNEQFVGAFYGVYFNNIEAGGNVAVQVSTPGGYNAYFNQVLAAGDVTLTGTIPLIEVASATSTNGSIAITNDGALEVDAATLNGTDAVNRSITLTSNFSSLAFGLISTNGPTASNAASAPLGSIFMNAPQGGIEDLSAWQEDGSAPSVLRAANATLTAFYGVTLANTGVDTYTNLTMMAGAPGAGTGNISAKLFGIDSVNDFNGDDAHAIHIGAASAYGGSVNISNNNGDLRIGSVRAYTDYGGEGTSGGSIVLNASGSIIADGSVGGGRINAADPFGNGGSIDLNAGGGLGTRGSGSDGTTGASYLSLSAYALYLTTGGDLFATNDQGSNNLNLYLYYTSAQSPYLYHYTSATAGELLAGTPAITFNGASSGGLLTVNSAGMGDGAGYVYLNADGDIRVQSWQADQNDSLGIYGHNISIDAPVSNTPALSIGDSSWLQIQAQGSLNVGSLASTGSRAGDSYVDLEAYGGNLTLGKVSAANANVLVYATGGDIVGSAGNQVLANNLTLTNTFGAIGADPTVSGSIPINLGVTQTLTLTNEVGGGSINLGFLNDPALFNLTLYTPDSPNYAGAHFRIAPVTTGFGLSGSANQSGVTLASLGTTGPSATSLPLVITADTPSITIASGAGAQLGMGYDLYFGNNYPTMAANLSGSAGQTVFVHLDDNASPMTSLTGNIALTNLQIDENLFSWHTPITANLTLTAPLTAFTLVRTGTDSDPTGFNGSSLSMSGSGQSFSAVEAPGVPGSAPGVMTVNATSASALDLTVNLQTAGIIDAGTINLGSLGAVNLSVSLNSPESNPFPGAASAIEGVQGNLISAASVTLSAAENYAGQATLGTSTASLNVNAPVVSLTSSGDIYLTTGGALTSLTMNVSHPRQDTNGQFNTNTENYVYQIGGSTSLTAIDDAADTATSLSFTSATPVAFTFTTDRTIDVGTINVAAGTVTLNANGNWTGGPYNIYAPIGIEQGSGSGITAGAVTLNANGFLGHAGTSATVLDVTTANLVVNVNGEFNIADSAALDSLVLNLTHGADQFGNRGQNNYSLAAPNIDLTLVDHFDDSWNFVQLQNLVSSTLQNFSLSTDANLTLGAYNGTTGDFTGSRIALGNTATLNLTSAGAIWGQPGGGTYTLSDAAATPVADAAAVIQVGTLNLRAASDIIFSPQSGITLGAGVSIPVAVNSLTVTSGGEVGITNVGSLDVVSATVTGSAYFRAIEAAPGSVASLMGGSLDAPITAANLQLVAYYGDIGSSAAPVVTNTPVLGLDSGADIYAANQSELSALSIISHHNKDDIGDVSNGGLNTLLVTDTSASGGAGLQLGVTDLGLAGGYQLTGSDAPQLAFSFQTDTSISVGALSAASVALISENSSILHIPGSGTIVAGSVSFTVPTGQSVGSSGQNILVDAPVLTVYTGGNMYVSDTATLDSFALNIGSVQDLGGGNVPVYQLNNGTAAHPLTFDVTGDIVNNTLDINAIDASRTDVPVGLSVHAVSSSIGVTEISDELVAGGTVYVGTESGNIFGLGNAPAGISASNVSLITRSGSVGDDANGNAEPFAVTTDTLTVLASGDMRITSPQTITNLTLQEWNYAPAAGTTLAVSTPGFSLLGTVNGSAVLDLSSINGTTTNVEVDTRTNMTLGTLALGSASLTLNTYFNNGTRSIESDGTNGSNANISTTGTVALNAYTGIGDTALITTDIGGALSLSNWLNAIDVSQISSKPLLISALNEWCNCSAGPITITAVSDLTLTTGLSAGNGSDSPVTLTAGGDINYAGTALNLNGGVITLSAGGSINGGDISNGSGASLTAAGTAAGSTGGISVGNIFGNTFNHASGAITLQAAGDVNLSGQMISDTSVSITSTNGSIYSSGNDTFGHTPTLTLTAAGDIGLGSAGSVGQWQLNWAFLDDPGTLNLTAQAGGQINLLSYGNLNAISVVGGGNVALQTSGNFQGSTPVGISFGQVTSTNGRVTLTTDNGDITASGVDSAITAGTAITLVAQQNPAYFYSTNLVGQAFNLGSLDAPLTLNAPQVSLTANGNIYALVPDKGLTDLSVARTYVSGIGGVDQAAVMPAGTVLISDVNADTVLSVVDGGWTAGNVSAINASYGSPVNLSYAGVNAIQLGSIDLNGGNLNVQATSPSDISITSTGGLIQANNFSFNLVDANGIDGTGATAYGGFGTAATPINTEITSLSGVTVGPTAGVFMNQTGPIAFTNLATGGDISVTTTRVSGALSANADIAIGNVTSNGGSVSFTADGAIVAANGVTTPSIAAHGLGNDGDVTLSAAAGVNLTASSISSSNGDVNIAAIAGGIAMAGSILTSNTGNLNVSATAGGIAMAGSTLTSNGNVTVSATAGDIAMAGSNLTSNNGNIGITATAGDVALAASTLNAANGNISIEATAGTIAMAASNVIATNGNISLHAADGGIDLTGAVLQSYNSGSTIALTADAGDIVIGSINTSASLDITATAGAINGTEASQNLTGFFNGISSSSTVSLNAATGIGTSQLPLSVNASMIAANTSADGADVHLVTGSANPGGQAVLDGTVGGALTVANFYNVLTLDSVQTEGDINVTEQNYYSNLYLNNVTATAPGATFTFVAPYGNISSIDPFGEVSASRIVLNALGDPSGGSLGQSVSPINVDAEVVIAAASGNIALNSLATGLTKMPLVASNGATPTVSITAAGDFQVGEVVAGTQGTVNITTSAGSILDDGDNTTQIYAGTVNLSAANAIGTAQTPISMTAIAYDGAGNVLPGNISALSTTLGNIYINQTGDAILQSLIAANGSINVQINDPAHGQSFLVLADTTGADSAGNDINVSVTNGDLTVDVAQAGMTAGTVNLSTPAGSIYGDGRADCCTNPNVSGNTVTLTAQNNIGSITNLANLSGTALGVRANQSTATTSANNSQIYIQYVGDVTLGAGTPDTVNPMGSAAQVLLAACGDLTLTGLNLPGVMLGLVAGTAGSGSVIDGINGGASRANPDATAASITFGAATNVGDPNASLWVNTPILAATANNGGVWINDAASTPVSVTSVIAGNGPAVIGAQGDLQVGFIYASGSATLNSANGSVLDGVPGGANPDYPNVYAGSVTVNAATSAGSAADALVVYADSISATATNGGVWINDANTTPVSVTSIIAGNGPVVIGSQGDMSIGSINAGTSSATLTSASGSVLDGINGGSNAGDPNIVASAVTVNAAANAGNTNDHLWVNAATISGSATTGGVWINDAATTPVTVASITSNGPVVIGAQGNLAIDSIDAGSGAVSLNSATGAVVDGIGGGSNANNPNVTAASVAVSAALNAGNASDALWVNAGAISGSATNGGVWINDAATTPVTVTSIIAGNGPVVVGTQGTMSIGTINAAADSATLVSATGSVLDAINGGSNAGNPNVTAGAVTVNAASNAGNTNDHLWVNAATISGSATTGGVWINDAATTPVTVASITAGGGPVVIGSQGNLLVNKVNTSGSVTLGSAGGAVLDDINGGSNAGNPNVTASAVTVNAAQNAGDPSDALWVNAAAISGTATNGGVWINDAATTPVTVASISSNGPVVIGAQGTLSVDAINAGSGSVALSSATGAILDGIVGGSNAGKPNVTAAAVTVNAALNAGNASDALWVNAAAISGTATNGGVWINDAASTPVTVTSIIAGNGPVVIGGQGNVSVDKINAGTNAATVSSSAGAVLDGIAGGSNAANPNIIAGAVSVNSAINTGNVSDPLWVNAATISGSSTKGGVWINDAATTPVTVASIISNGAVVIGAQGDLGVDAINAGSGSVSLNSATGAIVDAIAGGSNAGKPNVTAGAVSVSAALNAGNAADALWVNAAAISGTATNGGVWINDAATTPVTVTSIVAGNGPVVIGGQGNVVVDKVNAGTNAVTLSSAAGAVLDGIAGGSNAGNPNVTAGAVTVSSARDTGNPSDPLWVNAATISGSATQGGVWINDAATTPVTVASISAGTGPVVIGSQGDLNVQVINAGGSVTLNSAAGAVLDGIAGGSNAAHPNVTAAAVTVNSGVNTGNPSDPLWVNAAAISGNAANGGVWINDAATTPVTLASIMAGNGPVVINTQGNMILGSINAGTSDVTLDSSTGSILDGITGHSNPHRPNIVGGTVSLSAAGTVGTAANRVFVNAASYTATETGGAFINEPATPYPALPLLQGVAPVTVYEANTQAQIQIPQQLPITLIGLPLRMAPPIGIVADLLGIALPEGADSSAVQQDSTMGTASVPIFGGNEDEIGRRKAMPKAKKKPVQTTRNVVKKTKLES